jgi:uncharacterized RDD family membrane protein YckC
MNIKQSQNMQNNSSFSSYVFRRCFAFLYDSLLLLALFFVVTSIAIAFNDGEAIANHAFKLVLFLVTFCFFCWFWRNGGQTLGMQAWRIKVVSETNEALTYSQCFKRFVLGTFLFGFTLIFAVFNAQGQGIHDKLSNTKIVFKNKELS